jgi:hypothetical protein
MRDAVLGGIADGAACCRNLIDYAHRQSRIIPRPPSEQSRIVGMT